MKKLTLTLCAFVLLFIMGCREAADHEHSHDGENAHSHDTSGGHAHAPPHGGTPVVVAAGKFHLELVPDVTAGTMQAYVLDGHLEGYLQVPEDSFKMIAHAGDGTQELEFRRVPTGTSGDAAAKSSLFEAKVDWKRATEFEGNIRSITLNGATFTNITFSFPQGSIHDH